MQRALRKFASGKPSETPKNTPLGAVTLAIEQRKRVIDFLNKEKVEGARITSMGVVVRFVPTVADTPADFILVKEGNESEAIAALEQYGKKFKKEFVIAGVLFAVQAGTEKRPFAYLIDRTPEGDAALKWSWERQITRKPHKALN